MNRIIACIIVFGTPLTLALTVHAVIKTTVKRHREQDMQKKTALSKIPEDRAVLQKEEKNAEKSLGKIMTYRTIGNIIMYFIWLCTDIAGFACFASDMKNGDKLPDILFESKCFYLISPALAFGGLYLFFSSAKILLSHINNAMPEEKITTNNDNIFK